MAPGPRARVIIPGMGLRSDRRRRPRTRAAAAGALVAAVACAGAAGAAGKAVIVDEKRGDAADGTPDLTRLSLQRADDGRLRAGLTFADDLTPKRLVAKSGPPGSVCLKLFTNTKPGVLPPDFLICVTSDAKGTKLRASILAEQVNKLPKKVGTATITRPSRRSMVLRFSQSSVGRPAIIQFAAEATRPGCTKAGCVDTLPDAPGTAELTLRLEAPPE